MALDHRSAKFAVPKWVGIKTKETRSKLTDQPHCHPLMEAREQIARTIMDRLDVRQSRAKCRDRDSPVRNRAQA